MTEVLVWVDLETTGLIPDQGRILEIAMIITTPDLVPIVAKEMLVGPPLLAEDEAELDPVVRSMHERSGLLHAHHRAARHHDLVWVEDADEILLNWLLKELELVGAPTEKVILAGSTVRFDRVWIELWLPRLAEILHYRMADVSGMREFMRHWLPNYEAEITQVAQQGQHRALADLVDSIRLADYFRSKVIDDVA